MTQTGLDRMTQPSPPAPSANPCRPIGVYCEFAQPAIATYHHHLWLVIACLGPECVCFIAKHPLRWHGEHTWDPFQWAAYCFPPNSTPNSTHFLPLEHVVSYLPSAGYGCGHLDSFSHGKCCLTCLCHSIWLGCLVASVLAGCLRGDFHFAVCCPIVKGGRVSQ